MWQKHPPLCWWNTLPWNWVKGTEAFFWRPISVCFTSFFFTTQRSKGVALHHLLFRQKVYSQSVLILSSRLVVLNGWVATHFWVACTYLLLGRQNLCFSTIIVIYLSPNCVSLYFVGRQLPNVENRCPRQVVFICVSSRRRRRLRSLG